MRHVYCDNCGAENRYEVTQCKICGNSNLSSSRIQTTSSNEGGFDSIDSQNSQSFTSGLKKDSDLLSVIANYLKSFWLLFISAFLGALALDISGNLHNEYLQCENNGNIFDRCTDSSGLPYLLLGLPSLIFFVIAILVGIRATTDLRLTDR